MASPASYPVEQWSQQKTDKSLLTERQDSDGDVLWPLALLVNEVPCHSLLPFSHPAVVLATVLKAEAVDLQHKNIVAFFGYLELAQGLTLGKLIVEHWHSIGSQAGDEGAVEGPGNGEVAVRDVLGLQGAPKLHWLTHDVRPLLCLQPDTELLIWGEADQLASAWQSPSGKPAHLVRGIYNLLLPAQPTSLGHMHPQVKGLGDCFCCESPDWPCCRKDNLLPSMQELQGFLSHNPFLQPLLLGEALL